MRMRKLFQNGTYLGLVCLVKLIIASSSFSQGKGHGGGNGGGRGNSGTMGNGGGGRSGNGAETQRTLGSMQDADRDLEEHPGIPRMLNVNANSLRSGYQAALATNPNLTFGNYVAATRLAQNLGRRNPAITRNAILAGLANGD